MFFSSEGDEDGDADEDVESSGGRRQTKLCKSKPMRLNHKIGGVMDVSDDMPCNFDLNMCKTIYTIIGGHYLYRLKCLPKAREVSQVWMRTSVVREREREEL